MAEQETKPSGKGGWVTRIVVIAILVLATVFVVAWRGVVAEYKKAEALYEQAKYAEAYEAFDAVQARPLAALKVRRQARVNMGRCKAEMATETAFSAKTSEEFEKAVQLMKEAIELAAPSEEYTRRLTEYAVCAEKARKEEAQAAARRPTPAPTDEAPAPVEETKRGWFGW